MGYLTKSWPTKLGLLIPPQKGLVFIPPGKGGPPRGNGGGPPGQGGVTDPYFGSVTHLLHMDGSNGGTTFTDVIGHTWAPAGSTPITDTSTKKYGTASANLTGTNGRVATTVKTGADFGASDFTIEFWGNYSGSGAGSHHMVDMWAGRFLFRYSGGAFEWYSSGGATFSVANTWTTGVWTHLAVTRNGSAWNIWKDGVSIANATNSGTISSGTGSDLKLGCSPDFDGFGGYMDDFRVTKGVCRYTGTFTPPTAAFPDS